SEPSPDPLCVVRLPPVPPSDQIATAVHRSSVLHLFISILPRPPCSTLFPYTTLFRSGCLRRKQPRVSANAASRCGTAKPHSPRRSEEHTSELQSLAYLVCRLLLEKKKHYPLCNKYATTDEEQPVDADFRYPDVPNDFN